MYEHLKGKKILVIGSAIEEEIVKAAHEMGLYTVVVDNVLDRKIARAKVISDESWDISYTDTDVIVEKCREAGIDGVIAGYGEFRALAAARIAKKLGKPFYVTEEQIDLTRNKASFKAECAKYGIPVPRNYCENSVMTEAAKDEVSYPVIVKPADRSGRIGISICHDREQLDKAIEFAASKSETGAYVVEDYLVGTEFSSVYTAKKGEVSLSCVNAKYITADQKVSNFLCDCAVSPAPFLKRYEREIDDKIKAFLKGIGLENGMANMQGMVTEKGFYVFEMAVRINGNNDWKVIEKMNGINFLKMMMAYSLCGDMCDDLAKDDPHFSRYFCTLPVFSHEGTIAKFDITKVLEQPWATISNIHVEVGSSITEDGTNRQKLFAFLVDADNLDQLKERIKFMQENIVVEDADGNNMLFTPFNYEVLQESI